MNLSQYEEQLAREVFSRFADLKFAIGVYKHNQPLSFSTTATSSTALYRTPYYVVELEQVVCEAKVPGLDQDAFINALEEFMEKSRQHTFDILATEQI